MGDGTLGMNPGDEYIDSMFCTAVDSPRNQVECRYCGKGGLHWERANGRWMTHELNGNIHRCKK
jgi:hypothetical protein